MTGNRALAAGSNGQRRLGFDVGGIRFTCHVDDSRFDRLERHLRSYLHTVATTRRSGPVDIAVRFTVSDAEFERLQPRRPPDRIHTAYVGAPYDLWEDGSILVYAYPATASGGAPAGDHLFRVTPDGITIVARACSREPERLLRHLVTEALLSGWEDEGATSFHAACAVLGERDGDPDDRGQAVLVVGPKGAGKTTTVTMLGRLGLHLCSNDRTLVIPGSGETLGLPMAYRLGHGQVHNEPRLATLLDCGPEGDGPCEPSRKHYVTPVDLAGALGTGVRPSGRLGLILLPRLTPDDRAFWSAPATAVEVADELTACCYTPDDPAFRAPRFRFRRRSAAARAATARKACRQLAEEVPALRVGWGMDADLEAVHHGLRDLVNRRHG